MDSERAIRSIVAELVEAWNTGDGEGFARPFAEDADFVNVHGMHERGRGTITTAHQFIFSTFYKGSRQEYEIERIRFLGDHAAIVLLKAKLVIPAAEANKETLARPSLVFERRDGRWQVVAFQNTAISKEAAALTEQFRKFTAGAR